MNGKASGMLFLKSAGFLILASVTGVELGQWWSRGPGLQGRIEVTTDAPRQPAGAPVRPRPGRLCPGPGLRPGPRRPGALPLSPALPRFRGDTLWIHRREGHRGRPYWPGGSSGVTLDPGIDLGHVEPWLVEEAFGKGLSRRQLKAVRGALGVQGIEADELLRKSPTLRSITVDRATAAGVFPYLLRPYWRSLRLRFPTIDAPDTPSEVQTALLSLVYNRGVWNPDLGPLTAPLVAKRWSVVAELLRGMQQDHSLEGIRRRRRSESLLISENLSFRPQTRHSAVFTPCYRPGPLSPLLMRRPQGEVQDTAP
ncbi:MAG: hypothetical protein AAGM22_20650 [Acidobacteriota bacterium]